MSDKPLAERLQVKNGRRLAVLSAPRGLDASFGAGVARAGLEEADVVLLFAADRRRLEAELPRALKKSAPAAILWLAYPKLTSPLAGDLSRDVIHALAPKYGLDTVAQIAVDADWSALRLKRIG